MVDSISYDFLELSNIWYMQHSGLIHIAIGSWGLVTFGPKVCRGYGSFTFFLIYILGGISGNLISFLHTPEPTVGGTVSSSSSSFVPCRVIPLLT